MSESRNSGLRPKLTGVASPARAPRGALGNIEAARTASAATGRSSTRQARAVAGVPTRRKRLSTIVAVPPHCPGSDYSRRFVVAGNSADALVKRPAAMRVRSFGKENESKPRAAVTNSLNARE